MTSEKSVALALNTLKLLAHPVRLGILCQLIEQGETSAGEIVAQQAPRASQSQTSQYLRALREEGWVQARRDGQFVFYTIVNKDIKKIIKVLHEVYCSN